MKTRFVFQLEAHWPPGAWIASGAEDSQEALVRHGSGVAIHGDWFGEIVWDGDYSSAEFDLTDVVYGSGGKATDSGLKFVSSANTMDRLQHLHLGREWHVSNSLVCLLNCVDAQVPVLDSNCRSRFESIIQGLDKYTRHVSTNKGQVELTYYDNLQVVAGRVSRIAKPAIRREIGSFQHYRDFLESALVRCAENMRSIDRPHQHDWLGTISTGFDSPTVAALGQAAGLTEVCTFSQARGKVADDGTLIAKALGLDIRVFDRDFWRSRQLAEVPFLSSDGKGEDVYFCAMEEVLNRKVLLTGYAAGAWAAKGNPNPQLRRADQSGLSLTEYRLWANFIHLPLPTMGVANAFEEDLKGLAAELDPWRSGESYDKPFCRRVLTEANVAEELFGQGRKKAASVLMFDRRTLLSEDSRTDFLEFMRGAYNGSTVDGWRCRARNLGLLTGSTCANLAQKTAGALGSVVPLEILRRVGESERLGEWAHYEPKADYLFPWALHRAKRRYSSAAAQRDESVASD